MKILIIGCGGIGSYLVRELHRLIENAQIVANITLCDFDNVEPKNILYQNFTEKDMLKNKASVLAKRYGFNHMIKKIEKPEDLEGYNFIILCVDNSETRKLVFEYCYSKKDVYFIDGRAEGRSIAVFTRDGNNKLDMLKTLNGVGSTSCQLEYMLEQGMIDNGNVIVATIISQLVLNKLRGYDNLPSYIIRF